MSPFNQDLQTQARITVKDDRVLLASTHQQLIPPLVVALSRNEATNWLDLLQRQEPEPPPAHTWHQARATQVVVHDGTTWIAEADAVLAVMTMTARVRLPGRVLRDVNGAFLPHPDYDRLALCYVAHIPTPAVPAFIVPTIRAIGALQLHMPFEQEVFPVRELDALKLLWSAGSLPE